MGHGELPSCPTASVVMPCDTCVIAAGSFSRPSVEWLCASMKPGASTIPVPSTTGSPVRGRMGPTEVIVSPSTRTLPARNGPPVPSASWAPEITNEARCDCGETPGV